MLSAVEMLKQTRRLIYYVTRSLTPAQAMYMPAGFDNNIAWNVGHVIAIQQFYCYVRTGNQPLVSDGFFAMYDAGTSPTDWTTEPDMSCLWEMLRAHGQQLEADIVSGKIAQFDPFVSSSTVKINSLEDALVFNNFHEGLHLGTIMAIKNLLPSP